MNTLFRFLEWTAWEMTPPKPYGVFHLVFWLAGLPAVTLAAFSLRHTGEKANKRLLLGIGIFLSLAELYKQLFYTFYLGKGKYPFDRFPFQLCSIPMYLCLIVPWLKNGKLKQALYTFTASYGFMGGFVSYFSPESMCLPYWTLTLHSFTWHMTLISRAFYLVFRRRAGARLKDFLPAAAVYLCLCAVAFGINLLCYRCPGNDVNMFFIGPKPSPLVICRDIVKRFGWQVNSVVYISALTACAFLFYSAYLLIGKALKTRRRKARSF